jgi:hypothetical protein
MLGSSGLGCCAVNWHGEFETKAWSLGEMPGDRVHWRGSG